MEIILANKFRFISFDQYSTTLNGSCFQFDYKKAKNDSNKGQKFNIMLISFNI